MCNFFLLLAGTVLIVVSLNRSIQYGIIRYGILGTFNFYSVVGIEMINQEHFQRVSIKQRLDELHR
jgi:hypothetical protein